MSEQQFDRWLEQAAGRLPREREPRRDLWPGIEARINPRRDYWALPAVVAAVLALGLGISLWFNQGAGPMPEISRPRPAANLLAAAKLERGYRDALLNIARQQGALKLTGASRDLVEAELMGIALAQSQIRHALELQPDAEYLVTLLRRTHAQRLNFIQALGDKHEKITS